MATYAIGDIQGCFATLQRLLKRCQFNPATDKLWITGDLVNRGPDSLATLRWAYQLRDRIVMVLGNHDIHLLRMALGLQSSLENESLMPILQAPDKNHLLSWLQSRPLAYHFSPYLMVHAGLLPSWTLEQTLEYAQQIETVLQSARASELLAYLPHLKAKQWQLSLTGLERSAFILKILTYLRICSPNDEVQFQFTGPPKKIPEGFYPWFALPHPQRLNTTVVCGHWAALGFYQSQSVLALDSGCVWGQKLTAVRLEDQAVFQEPAYPLV